MTIRRLPAEWEAQSGIMLTWPHDRTDWQPILPEVEPVFAEIAFHASRREKVLIVARDADLKQHINKLLSKTGANAGNIRFALADSDDSWARDHGPITLEENQQPLLLDFQFNAWGGKYGYHHDNLITSHMAQQSCFKCPTQQVAFVLEGGSIESDGAGTLLTTNCLLTGTRNPGFSKPQIEQFLQATLGIQLFHWLQHGELAGDDTDAHIDTLARFVSPTQIVYVKCDDPKDEHFTSLQHMENDLAALRDRNNQPYMLTPLPLPDAVFNHDGQRLPATYANFLIINGAVLLPIYGQDKDQDAIAILQKCFPSREIIAINCLSLVKQSGSLHCLTMQFPEGVLT